MKLNNAVIDVPISSKYKRLNNGRRLEIYKPTFGADNGVFKCATVIGINVQTTADIELDVFCKYQLFLVLFISFLYNCDLNMNKKTVLSILIAIYIIFLLNVCSKVIILFLIFRVI